MATLSNLITTGSAGVGFPPGRYAGCGFARGLDIGYPGFPLVINAATTFTSSQIAVAGLNGFMLTIDNITGAGTITISFEHIDPRTLTAVTTRVIAAAVTGPQIQTFGAFSTIAPADVFGTITLVFLANAAQETVTGVRLWGHAR